MCECFTNRINEIKVPVLILISCVFVCVVCLWVCRHLRACLCVPVCMTRCGVYVSFMHLPGRGEFIIMNDKLFKCSTNVYENDILCVCVSYVEAMMRE